MRSLVFYVVTIAVFGAGILAALQYGQRLERAREFQAAPTAPVAVEDQAHSRPSASPTTQSSWLSEQFGSQMRNLRHPLAILFLQVITVIVAARLCGRLF